MRTRAAQRKLHLARAAAKKMCRVVRHKRVSRFRSMLRALRHAQECGTKRVLYASLGTWTFIAYRPSVIQAGRWQQCVYGEIDGVWITSRKWAWSAENPDEYDDIAVLIREEEAIRKAEIEEAMLWAASRPGPKSQARLALLCH